MTNRDARKTDFRHATAYLQAKDIAGSVSDIFADGFSYTKTNGKLHFVDWESVQKMEEKNMVQKIFDIILEKLQIELDDAHSRAMQQDVIEDLLYYDGLEDGVDKSIEIVKAVLGQFAAVINDGEKAWIPCSERMPEDDCIVWVSFSNPHRNHVAKVRWEYNFDSMERCFKWGNGRLIKEMPVAWKPYYTPEPYRENCRNRHENGNCLAVGGFCTAVLDKYCQYQPKEKSVQYLSISEEEE